MKSDPVFSYDDTLMFGNAKHGVRVDLRRHVASGEGHDRVFGFSIVNGTKFADVVIGSYWNLSFYGFAGDDRVVGGAGADWLVAMGGNDVIKGGRGQDHIEGDLGNDVLRGGADRDYVDGGPGRDRVYGGGGPDELSGDSDFSGVKWRNATYDDYIDGGGNIDRAWFNDAPRSMFVDLVHGTARGQGHDELVGIEWAYGSEHDDTLIGTNAPTTFYGGTGNDLLIGHGGDDLLSGDAGTDTAKGGPGDDECWSDETVTGCEHTS